MSLDKQSFYSPSVQRSERPAARGDTVRKGQNQEKPSSGRLQNPEAPLTLHCLTL